ncbi:MAG: VWA domain-containing protein [Actinobacteria bacterium]|nr:VWA domain-containing protein [Actinomycetota bacterium]
MSVAVDVRLRLLARRVAASTFVRPVMGRMPRRGVRRLAPAPAHSGGDLDIDRTLDRSDGLRPSSIDQLVTRAWRAYRSRVVLLIDRSGSMRGGAVARAAVAAAAISLATRGRADCGVIAFSRDRIVLQPMSRNPDPFQLVDRILTLRGHGTTDLAGALEEAGRMVRTGSGTGDGIVVLLSDCIATEGSDPMRSLSGIAHLHVITPSDEPDSITVARSLTGPTGGKVRMATSVRDIAPAVFDILA